MKSAILSVFICLLLSTAMSQPYVNVVQLGYGFQPAYSLTDYEDNYNFSEWNAAFNIPLVLKNNDVILLNLSSRQVDISGRQNPNFSSSHILPGNPYHTLTGRIGYRKALKGEVNATLLFQYRRSGSLGKGVTNATQFGGVALIEKQKSPTLSLRFGAYVSEEFFGPLVVPILGFDWKISEKWYAFANLPISGTIDYQVGEKFHTGFTYVGIVSSFKLPGDGEADYIHSSSTDLTFYGDLYLSPNLVLRGKAGRTMGRYLQQYANQDKIDLMLSALRFGDERQQLNPEIGDGWLAEIQLIFRVRK